MTATALPIEGGEQSPPASRETGLVVARPMQVGLLRPIAEPDAVIAAQEATRDLIAKALKKDRDYGLIPGTQKETLLKAGAERIVLAFGCYARFRIVEREADHNIEIRWNKSKRVYNNAHAGDRTFTEKQVEGVSYGLYRYVIECEIVLRETGQIVGSFAGSASTMESKYIDRPRDCENTIIKMAEKRALVGATLTTFGLSDQFTQDTEDMPEEVRDRTANESKSVTSTDDPSSDFLVPFGDFKGTSVRQKTPEGVYVLPDSELVGLARWCTKKRDSEATPAGRKKFESWLDGFEGEMERRAAEERSTAAEKGDGAGAGNGGTTERVIGDPAFKSRYETLFPTGDLKGAKLDEAAGGNYIVPLQALQDVQRWVAGRMTATAGPMVIKKENRAKFEQLAVDLGMEIVRRMAAPPERIEDTGEATGSVPPPAELRRRARGEGENRPDPTSGMTQQPDSSRTSSASGSNTTETSTDSTDSTSSPEPELAPMTDADDGADLVPTGFGLKRGSKK